MNCKVLRLKGEIMREAIKFFGEGLPYLKQTGLRAKLIAIEATDGVGRSTQIDLLEEWLQVQGYAVMVSGWTALQLDEFVPLKWRKTETCSIE